MNNIRHLISGYLDGDLSDAEADRLATALKVQPAELERFVLNYFIHSQLLDWLDQQHISEGAIGCTIDDADLELAPRSLAFPHVQPAPSRPRFQWLGAVAAALLIAAGVAALSYVMASRPAIVAQITDATNCQWAGPQSKLPAGTLLENGQQLELEQGNAVVTFASGAKVLLEGPATLRIESENKVFLTAGRLAAKVPTQARGFTVNSSLAQFIDRGTEFMLKLEPEKSFELHVFDGLVDVLLDKRFGKAAQHPAHISELRAVAFNVESGDITLLHFQEGKQMPF